jgi:hypothetical protein
MTMTVCHAGGCACGAIRYEISAEPLFMLNCHCRDCQRETGSGFAPVMGVARAGFTVTKGSPKTWDVVGGSGKPVRRTFCGECGSSLYGLPEVRPDLVTVRAASLDDPTVFRPTSDIFTSQAQPWDPMDPSIGKLDRIG